LNAAEETEELLKAMLHEERACGDAKQGVRSTAEVSGHEILRALTTAKRIRSGVDRENSALS
jgi:hypothetical protein